MAHPAPAWMETLVEVISACVEAQSPMGPLGYRYLAQGDPCELLVYPTPVELVGGAEDGAVVLPGFSLDLHVLLAHFDRVEACQWSPNGLGPFPTTQTAHVSPSRGSIKATTSGCASWQSRLRMKSRAFDSLLAHPSEGNATPTRRIAGQVRAASPLHVKAEGSLCVLPEGDGVEPASCPAWRPAGQVHD